MDIVLSSDGEFGETWVEVKSKQTPFKASEFKQSKSIHKEFFGDWAGYQSVKREVEDQMSRTDGIEWRFAQFKTKSGKRGPSSDIKNARQWLCDMPEHTNNIYRDNFGVPKHATERLCRSISSGVIDIHNTMTVLEEVFFPKGVLAELKEIALEYEASL